MGEGCLVNEGQKRENRGEKEVLSVANYPNYFPGYQQQYMQQPYQGNYQQQPAQMNGRMVTSREEALGVPVDFNAPVILPDLAHGVVYVKIFNQQTGAADFIEYRRADPQHMQNPTAVLEERVSRLESAVRGMMSKEKEGDTNV